MEIKHSAFAIIILVLTMIIRTLGNPDYAEEDYEVTGLDMRIAVSRDHAYEAEEFISVDIPADLHRIAFAIPDGASVLEDLTVEGEKAEAVKKSSGKYVVIKDPELLTAGHHRYKIRFRLLEPADSTQGKDVFSFDVFPEGWKQPVKKLHTLMWFPYGFPIEDIRPVADDTPDVRLTVKREPQSRSFTVGAGEIPKDFSLRLEADLPDGYWE